MQATSSRLWKLLNGPAACFLLALLAVSIAQGIIGPRPYDDAYITYRYARNISLGLGFVYNPGEPVLGTTTPFYTLVLSLMAALLSPSAIPLASYLLAILADAVSVFLVYRIALMFFPSPRSALLLAGTFLLLPLRLDVATGGMETSFFTASLLFFYWAYLSRRSPNLIGMLAAALIIIRVDAALAVAPVFVAGWFRDRGSALRAGGVCLFCLLPWLAWSTLYFGSPLPNSILAKSIAYRNPPAQALVFLWVFLGTGTLDLRLPMPLILPAGFIALVTLGIGAWRLFRRRPEAIPVCAFPILYCIAMAIFNPAMWFPWYYIPLMPGLLFLMFAAVMDTAAAISRTRFLMAGLLAAVLVALPAAAYAFHPAWDPMRARERALSEAALTVAEEIRPGDLVLAPDIGIVGWRLEQAKILDPIGLVSPEALNYIPDLSPGQWISPRLVRDRQPAYVIAHEYFISASLQDDPSFQAAYTLIRTEEYAVLGVNQRIEVFRRNDIHASP